MNTERLQRIEIEQPEQQQGTGALVPQPFFKRHHEGLAEVFDMVGVPDEALTSIDAAVEHTQPWTKGDHSRPDSSIAVDPAHSGRLHELYTAFGQRDEVVLPAGHYQEIIVPGAVQRGNRRRLELLQRVVNNGQVTTDRITLLGGQRRIFPEVEKDDVDDTIGMITAKGVVDPWAEKIAQTDTGTMWETDAFRLAALEQLGSLTLNRINVRLNEQHPSDEPEPLKSYEFTWRDVPLSLMHTLAVDRPNGQRRHTTEACVQDWLQQHQPPQGARIGFIGANPHLERMGRATAAVIRASDREDLQLVVAGSAAPPDLKHSHFLGEIARNLYEDQRDLRHL